MSLKEERQASPATAFPGLKRRWRGTPTSVICGRLGRVTDRTAAAPSEITGYVLSHEADGTSFTVRENLADILERELLGPINGPEEVLPFRPAPAVSRRPHRPGQVDEHVCIGTRSG